MRLKRGFKDAFCGIPGLAIETKVSQDFIHYGTWQYMHRRHSSRNFQHANELIKTIHAACGLQPSSRHDRVVKSYKNYLTRPQAASRMEWLNQPLKKTNSSFRKPPQWRSIFHAVCVRVATSASDLPILEGHKPFYGHPQLSWPTIT